MKNVRRFVPAIAALVAFAGVAAGADIVWRTLAIRGVPGASIEVPQFMKEYVASEKSTKGDQARTLFVVSGIDDAAGDLFCMLTRQPYAHDQRNLTAEQSQALTASQITDNPGIPCMMSRVPDSKYEQSARSVSGFGAASCVTIYVDPADKSAKKAAIDKKEVIESDTMIAAPRYFYRFVCADDVNREARVEVGGRFIWDQGLKEQVTHMVDSLKLPMK